MSQENQEATNVEQEAHVETNNVVESNKGQPKPKKKQEVVNAVGEAQKARIEQVEHVQTYNNMPDADKQRNAPYPHEEFDVLLRMNLNAVRDKGTEVGVVRMKDKDGNKVAIKGNKIEYAFQFHLRDEMDRQIGRAYISSAKGSNYLFLKSYEFELLKKDARWNREFTNVYLETHSASELIEVIEDKNTMQTILDTLHGEYNRVIYLPVVG